MTANLSPKQEQGRLAEDCAAEFLRQKGLSLLQRNALYSVGELDLVMRDGDTLVFVEVRYRRSAGFGGGAASIDASKRRKLVHAASQYLAAHRESSRAPCRFDVIDACGDPEHRPLVRDQPVGGIVGHRSGPTVVGAQIR